MLRVLEDCHVAQVFRFCRVRGLLLPAPACTLCAFPFTSRGVLGLKGLGFYRFSKHVLALQAASCVHFARWWLFLLTLRDGRETATIVLVGVPGSTAITLPASALASAGFGKLCAGSAISVRFRLCSVTHA
jgi:hypothetical protein